MAPSGFRSPAHATAIDRRLVRYADLRPCTTAFIDTRTPGSAQKENFTIIGPGVAENAGQHVHIDIPHGFNIGAARQPPGCVNSQHSHETAEVFVVRSGRWAFKLGENGDDGTVEIGPGDAVSIPVHVFRGFENIGEDTGFMFAVLGGDDPGHVTWAPYVFEQAQRHGLILLDDGSLVDTTIGESVPPGKRRMPATTAADVRRLDRMTVEEFEACIVRYAELTPPAGVQKTPAGLLECPIIGAASPAEGLGGGKMSWPHGFQVRHVAVKPGDQSKTHSRAEEEVILMYRGKLTVGIAGSTLALGPGDTLTVPIGSPRQFANRGDRDAEFYVVRGGDQPAAAMIIG